MTSLSYLLEQANKGLLYYSKSTLVSLSSSFYLFLSAESARSPDYFFYCLSFVVLNSLKNIKNIFKKPIENKDERAKSVCV